MGKKKRPSNPNRKKAGELASTEQRPEYLPPKIAAITPIVPDKNAVEGAKSAFSMIKRKKKFMELFSDKRDSLEECDRASQLYLELERISLKYWHIRRIYKQKPKPKYALQLSRVRKNALRLEKTLASLPLAVRTPLSLMLEHRSRNGRMLSKFSELLEDLVLSVDKVVTNFENSEKDETVDEAVKVGARSKKHVQKLIGDLLALWCGTGKTFERRYDTCERPDSDPAPNDEYVSEAVEFVTQVALAIDSNLEAGEVVSALKRHPEPARAVNR